MKIGILTMNYTCNYGGILQCVALRNVLEGMGYEVEVIRFSSKNRGRMRRKLMMLLSGISFRTLFYYVSDILSNIWERLTGRQKMLSDRLLSKNRLFIDKYIRYTELCNDDTIGKLVNEHALDAIVIGSDKVWGELPREQLVYMGDWTPPFRGKLISYAACSSFPVIPKHNFDKIHNLLNSFSAISVRDNYTRDLFKCYTDINMNVVLDPAFLYDYAAFLKRREEKPYILTYILGREIEGGHKRIIELIKEIYGDIKVKAIILSNESTDIVEYADEVIDDADPQEWMNCIYNASFVYTDSFHGIVFSLKFQKQFVAYYREASRASRLLDLKDRFSLDSVIVSSVNQVREKSSITTKLDYQMVSREIEKQKGYSLSFLQNTLSVDAN